MFFTVLAADPRKMPAPSLTALLRPFGQFDLTQVLWLQVDSSYPYEIALVSSKWPRACFFSCRAPRHWALLLRSDQHDASFSA